MRDVRSDEELMTAYVAGDQAAFRELFDRFAPMLLRLIRRQVRGLADAQDLVQQTFLQLHRARLDYQAGLKVRPWIVTIAMNLRRDHLRRRGNRLGETADPDTLPDPRPAPDDDVAPRVRAALATLPADQREVIELHWFEELAFAEIGAVVGAREGAVRVRAHRGYAKLRQALGSAAVAPGNEGTHPRVRRDDDLR
jgi:RNA polymerase sigma-70 factor (ECF subfamily)